MLESKIGKGPALDYAQLGISIASFIGSSTLVAQHYSLGVQMDDEGTIIGFARERAMTSMLDSAADRAKEQLAAVAKANMDGSIPTILFQSARGSREGKPGDKVDALRDYWSSSAYSRMMVLISEGAK